MLICLSWSVLTLWAFRSARQMFYTRVRAYRIVTGYAALLDDHENGPVFADLFGHQPEGWVYLDQALDAFYHGALR